MGAKTGASVMDTRTGRWVHVIMMHSARDDRCVFRSRQELTNDPLGIKKKGVQQRNTKDEGPSVYINQH